MAAAAVVEQLAPRQRPAEQRWPQEIERRPGVLRHAASAAREDRIDRLFIRLDGRDGRKKRERKSAPAEKIPSDVAPWTVAAALFLRPLPLSPSAPFHSSPSSLLLPSPDSAPFETRRQDIGRVFRCW